MTRVTGQLVYHQVGWVVTDLEDIPQPAGLPPLKMKAIIFQIDEVGPGMDAQLHFPMAKGEAKLLAEALLDGEVWTPPKEIIRL